MKQKYRKIYHRKDKIAFYKKLRHDTGSAMMTLLIAVVIGFVGYSAGKPVFQFLKERNLLAPPEQYSADSVKYTEIATEEYFPTENNFSNDSSDEQTENSQTETEPETEENLGFVQKAPSVKGYLLDESALMSENALTSALDAIPEGISHLLIPLKLKGGAVYYATSVKDAARCQAVQAFLPLSQIYQTVSAKGFEPVALINTLEDTFFSKTYPDSSYYFPADGTLWKDQSTPEETTWLAPFSILAQEYLSAFCTELETAGFRTIICDGLVFPNFPRTELSNLNPECSETDRWKYLTQFLTAMRTAAPETVFFVRVDGEEALSGNTEAIQAAEAFPADCLLISTQEQNWEQIQELSQTVPIIPEFSVLPDDFRKKSYVLNPD